MTSRLIPVLTRLSAALVVAGLLALWLQRPGPKTFEVEADFARAGLNIRPGDEVRVRGFPVGTIGGIEVDRRDFSARYTLVLEQGVAVAANTTATVVPKTVFGDKYVALEPASADGKELRAGAKIPRERTRSSTELQEVFDKMVPLLTATDPVTLGNVIAATGAGLGNGEDLARSVEGFEAMLAEFEEHRDDVDRLLTHSPGASAAFARGADDFATMSKNFGLLASDIAADRPQLVRFLRENADLMAQASELIESQQERIGRVTSDGLTLLDLVAAHPGSIDQFLSGAPRYINGIPESMFQGTLRANIANLFIVFPYLDSKGPGSDAAGGNGVGPEVEIDSPPPPGEPIDVSPITEHEGEEPPVPTTTQSSSGSGLEDLLGPVQGGGG